MRAPTLLALILGLGWTTASAPAALAKSTLSLGAVLGASRSTVDGLETDGGTLEGRAITGFTARYRAIYQLRPRIALETSLGFTRRGGQVQIQDANRINTITHTGEIRDNSIEMPLRLRVNTATMFGLRTSIFAGPTLGVRLGTQYEAALVVVNRNTGVATLTRETLDLEVSRVVLSGTMGLELGRTVGDFFFSLIGQYRTGFGELLNDAALVLGNYELSGGQPKAVEFMLGVSSRL